MQIRNEHTLGSDALHGKVISTYLIGLAPILFGGALRYYQPYTYPHLLGTILGLTIGHILILAGAYNMIFREDLATVTARRLQSSSRIWFPPLLTATRYAFFVLCFILLWISITSLGIYFSLFTTITLFTSAVLIPLHRLITEFIPMGRGRQEYRFRRTLVSLRSWSVILLVLAYATDRFKAELDEGNTPPFVIFLWLLGILSLAGSLILWMDEMLHPEKRPSR